MNEKNRNTESVYVTRRFWDEINFTAHLASRLAGEHIESTGMGIARLGSALTYRNEIIEQEAAIAEIRASWSAAILPREENSYVSIKWHSHGHFDRFHSTMDDNFIAIEGPDVIDHQKHRNKRLNYEIKKENGYYTLQNCENKIRIKANAGLEDFIESAEDLTFEDKYISLVINHESYDSEKPDPAKCFGEATYFDGDKVLGRKSVNLVVIDDHSELNKIKILEEVASKIKYKGKYLKEFPNYEIVKQDVLNEQKAKEQEFLKRSKMAKLGISPIKKENSNKEPEEKIPEKRILDRKRKAKKIIYEEPYRAADYKCEKASFEDLYDRLELRNEGDYTFKGNVKPVSFVQEQNYWEPRIEDPESYKKRVTMDWETENDLEKIAKECRQQSNAYHYGLRKLAEAYYLGPSEEDSLVGDIFLTLAGDYYIGKKQYHDWASRLEIFKDLYDEAKLSDYVIRQIKKAMPYLESNKYLNSQKPKIAKAIKKILKKGKIRRAIERIAAALKKSGGQK